MGFNSTFKGLIFEVYTNNICDLNSYLEENPLHFHDEDQNVSAVHECVCVQSDRSDTDINYFYVSTVHFDSLMLIIIPTYQQINSAQLILQSLRHVSLLIHHLQGVYSCVS